jgi:hypothetical protein
MQPKRYYQQLKSTSGADVVVVDVTSSNLDATFRFDNIEAKLGKEWCYGLKVRLYIRTTVDQPASAGSIIRPDQLYRILSSFQLKSDDIGTLYQPGDMNGPALGLIAQVVSNGYRFPTHLRSDIPAADGDTNVVLVVDIPLAHMCFWKGHQTGIWNGFLKRGGELKVTLASSTALAAVSTGAATKATTDVRAELVYTSEPEARPPVFWHWRLRQTIANETKHTIRNLCQGQGITGSSGVGKIGFLAYLSDQNGLGGAGSVGNITRIYPKDRSQQSHNMSTPFFGTSSYLLSFIEETRPLNIYGAVQGISYPQALGTNQEGAPNGATTLFLPYIWPDVDGQQVSKLQEWQGDYNIEHDYTATPAAQAFWLTLEQSYLTAQQKEFLMGERMGLPSSMFTSYPKVRALNDAGNLDGQLEQARKLRGLPEKVRAK